MKFSVGQIVIADNGDAGVVTNAQDGVYVLWNDGTFTWYRDENFMRGFDCAEDEIKMSEIFKQLDEITIREKKEKRRKMRRRSKEEKNRKKKEKMINECL